MRTVQIYINDKKIDLFNDEQIEITSSVQNVQDISKVYTDFSQTFTIPCTKNNNAIFEHYYTNDVDATFAAKNRQPARIEINSIPFRRGKVQLEGAELRDGEAYAYKITFYGDVITLKDLFGDDKLKDLDYSSIQHTRSGANVQTTITSTSSLDVRYPLISSSRVWQYGDASVNDISNSSYPIDFEELFPALRVAKIFDLIESQYGVTFNGNFLTDKRFTNLYTWWKNRESSSFTSEGFPLEFNTVGLNCNADFVNGEGIGISQVTVKYIDVLGLTLPVDFSSAALQNHFVKLNIYNTSSSATYYIDVYKNGILSTTITGSGDALHQIVNWQQNVFGLNDVYTFELRSTGAFTFDFDIKYTFLVTYNTTGGGLSTLVRECQFTTASNSITGYLDWNTTAPDIRVADYFAGVLKMFNMTCYPLDEDFNFQIEPLNDWYANGEHIDITQYVDVDTIEIERPKLYKEIVFDWKESKSFMNEAYKDINNRNFGSLREYFGYDGGEFKVELPFETLNFNKFTGENLQVAYSLESAPSYTPYVPNPVMLYLYDSVSCDFYFDNGTSTVNITNYLPFGQDIFYISDEFTINFNEEISSLTLTPESNSLYKVYYKKYLVNLFDNKTRIIHVTANLPLRLLNYISLQDALIIRDKKYRINEMRTNLTSGVVKLELISDWNAFPRRIVQITDNLMDAVGGKVVVPVKPVKPNKGGTFVLSGTGTFTTPPRKGGYTTEENLSFTVAANATGADRIDQYEVEFFAPDGTSIGTDTIVIAQSGSTGNLLTESGSNLITEGLDNITV